MDKQKIYKNPTVSLDKSKNGVKNSGDDSTKTRVIASTKKEKSKNRFYRLFLSGFCLMSSNKKDKTKPKEKDVGSASKVKNISFQLIRQNNQIFREPYRRTFDSFEYAFILFNE